MRISHILPILAALLAGVILSLAAAAFGARTIEDTSAKAVENQMRLGGYDWVSVSADGLQIVLTGTAPDEKDQLAAQRAAGHVVDPARVMNVMSVAQTEAIPAPEFSIEILRNDTGISLIGLVPAAWDREGFIASLKKSSGTGSVADLLEQADYPQPETWNEAMEFGLTAIGLLPRSKISLAADQITVTALADSTGQKALFERRLDQERPNSVPVTVKIGAPRPAITPFTVRFVIDNTGPRFDACAAETATGHLRILATAKSLGIDMPECTVGIGAPSSQWAAAVETGMRALDKIGAGSLTFSNGDVTLIAAEGTDQITFDHTIGELRADLPPGFTLHATLPVPIETETAEDRPEFIVTRSPEGQVQLRGRITDERSRIATEALARSEFGAQSVYSAMRVDEDLPQGWAVRSLAAVEALAQLANGSVVMTDELVSVRGVTGNSEAKAEISGMLAEKLGEGEKFTIDVTYERKLDPVLNLPTPEVCVSRANDIVAASKIVFDPGSTELNEAANDTLDRIAEALKDCEDVDIEIGAHSDSQGGEEMNLALSAQRANAVLDGLLVRRVAGVSFTAQGYGESQPIADNGTEVGREANRRIEFKLLGDDGHSHDGEAQEEATDVEDQPADGETE